MADNSKHDKGNDTDCSDNEITIKPQANPVKINADERYQLPIKKKQQKHQFEFIGGDTKSLNRGDKVRSKLNREMSNLENNEVLNTRLRSASGNVYSNSIVVDTAAHVQTSTSETELEAVEEEDTEMASKTDKLISMISKLQSSVDVITKKLTTQEILTSNAASNIRDVEEECTKNADAINSLEADLRETQFQLKLVRNVVIKQDQQIGFLRQTITEMQQREMNPNIVVSGIPETLNENTIAVFNDFVASKLEIQELIPADRAFRIGNGGTRPLIVQLRDPQNKGKLFANAKKLKGKVNAKKKPYFISDHLPEQKNEERRRANQLVAENKKKPSSHQLDMEFRKGKLFINQEPYTKSVAVPSAGSILKPDDELFDKADEIDFVKGTEETYDGSFFVSYAAAVKDFEDINAAYTKIKMKFSDATHVACAYRIPGANVPQNQDYVDDHEYGCGRTMLKVLRDQQLMNIVVFLVRYYGGKHLGRVRYDIFKELARKAVKELVRVRAEQGGHLSQVPETMQQPLTGWETTEPEEDWNQSEQVEVNPEEDGKQKDD